MILSPTSNSIDILGVKIHYYGLIIAFAIIVSLFLLKYLVKKSDKNLDFAIIYDISPFLILVSILSARVYYVLINWSFYSQHLVDTFKLSQGGLSIHGTLLGGLLFLVLFLKHKKVNILNYCDVFACVLPLGQAIGRLGNYFNQEAFGLPCNYPWCMYIAPEHRPLTYYNSQYFHPTFLYELLLNLIIFLILNYIYLKFPKLKSGTILALYFILYSIVRIFVEFLRIDAQVFLVDLPLPIVVSLGLIVFNFIFLLYLYMKTSKFNF